MPTLQTLIANLKAVKCSDSHTLWNLLPLSRRAAVLALLYQTRSNDLCCAVMIRSNTISYGGDAALPGGKASEGETAWTTALRETQEELGLPDPDHLSKKGYHLEPLSSMPLYLSSKYLVVLPELSFLHMPPHILPKDGCLPAILSDPKMWCPDEVSNVHSVSLSSLLQTSKHHSRQVNWNGLHFIQHKIQLPVSNKQVGEPAHFVLWGLTANILIDIARVAYKCEPPWRHRKPNKMGDNQLIEAMMGELKSNNKALHFTNTLGSGHEALTTREP